jgi:NADH-ubiquinone oxidoreductase chain 4L
VILTVTTSAMNRYMIMKIIIILDGKVKNLFMVEIILVLLFMTVISLFFICVFIIKKFNVNMVSGIVIDIIIALLFILNFSFEAILLLRLEFVVLSVYYVLFIYLSYLGRDYFFSIIFLTFRVCEGVLGLSILVSLIRTHGNDYFQSFSLL